MNITPGNQSTWCILVLHEHCTWKPVPVGHPCAAWILHQGFIRTVHTIEIKGIMAEFSLLRGENSIYDMH